MAGAAGQTGDTDSSETSGLIFCFQVVVVVFLNIDPLLVRPLHVNQSF